jgi:hypothetical protein
VKSAFEVGTHFVFNRPSPVKLISELARSQIT